MYQECPPISEDSMRWVALVGIALCSSVLGAAVLVRAMSGRVIRPESAPTGESQSSESAVLAADNLGSAPGVEPAEAVPAAADDVSNNASEENRQDLSEGLRAALRARDDAKAQGKVPPSEVDRAVPQAGSEVDDLARQLAPALEQEALSQSQKPSPEMREVEGELMDTWKEQKQILAGRRETADSVLLESH